MLVFSVYEIVSSNERKSPVRVRIRHMRPRSLSLKRVLATVLTASVILVLTIVFSYLRARKTVETQTSADAQKVTQSYAQQLDSYVDRVAVVPRTIAARQEAT